MARDLDQPLVLVVINNDGGGIFSFLPLVAHDDVFEQYFATPHGLTFRAAAELFGCRYAAPTDRDAFTRLVKGALDSAGLTIVEVQTSREENAALHREIEARVADAVAASLADARR